MERGPEAETVCCRLTREAATISDVWASLMRERPVLKIPAPSGRSGVSGPSARSLVEAEFRYEQSCRSREKENKGISRVALVLLKRNPEPKQLQDARM